MANISWAFAHTCTTTVVSSATTSSGAELYVPWSNPGNVERPGNLDSFATASITVADQETDWLVATNFEWQRDVPSGATLTGLIVWIEGYDSTTANSIQCAEAKLVIGGSITGTDQSSTATGRILGHDGGGGGSETHQLWIGAEGNTWGTTPSVAEMNASDFGVAFRLKDVADGTATTINVDSVMVALYWEKAADCVIVPTKTGSGNTESGMAPYNFHAHATESTWGDCDPDKVAFKWAVSGPEGWSQTVTDPRPGLSVNGQTRDLATDAWGYNMAWWFDVPGTYTVTATMYYNDTSTGAVLTDVSNTITVTVAANTRTKYRIAASGGDYTTLAAAWSAAGSSNDVWFEIESGHTETLGSELSVGGNNWLIAAEAGYSVRPLFKRDGYPFRIPARQDTSFFGIKCDRNTVGSQCSFAGGYDWDGVACIDCEADHQNSCFEITDSQDTRRILLCRFQVPEFDRYVIYAFGGGSRDVVVVGGSYTDNGVNGAEGYFRLSANSEATNAGTPAIGSGQRVNVLWGTGAGTTNKSFLRTAWSYSHGYQNHLTQASQFGISSYGNDTVGNYLSFVLRLDGNTCRTVLGQGHGRSHTFFCNNVMPSAVVRVVNNGVLYKVHLSHNLITPVQGLSSITSDLFMGTALATEPTYFYGVRWAGNMFALANPTYWGGGNNHYWYQNNGYDVLDWTKYNSYTNGSGTLKHFRANISGGTFGSAKTSYTPTEWIATAKSTGDIVGGYVESDLVAASDFLPTNTAPIEVVTQGTHRVGVFVDYRGVLRDSNAANWYIGPVGAETGPPPTSTTTSSATTSTLSTSTLSTSSTSSEVVPSYLALSAGSQFIVFES